MHGNVVNQLFDAVVAVNAVERAMDGHGETVRRKQRERFAVTVDRALIGGISVAIEAIGVGKFLDNIRRRKSGRDHKTAGHQQNKQWQLKFAMPAAEVHTPLKSAVSSHPAHRGLRIVWHFLTGGKSVRRQHATISGDIRGTGIGVS